MNAHIPTKRIGCVLRQILQNLKKAKALARCDITPWIHAKDQSVIPDGYCRTVRRGLHSATVTQLWYRSTSNTTVQYMERVDDKTKANASGRTSNNLHESRFKKILFIFRLSGLPIKLQPVSRIYKLYSATITVCFCTTTMCLLMDTFVHRHQLNYAMKKLRVFIAFALALCLHINVR
jgi:hypothetical protein